MGSSSKRAKAGGSNAPRRIAILGFAETTKDAPFSDPCWEMWGMNGLWRVLPPEVPPERFAAWFELHTVPYILAYEQAANIGTQQSDWLKQKHPFPVWTQDFFPEFPNSQRFPIEELVEGFGIDYFTSSVAFELAFALAQPGVSEIGLWGIDLTHGTEWGDQRPCAEYWIGRAVERGIKVTIHPHSALLKQRFRYGYDIQNPVVEELKGFLTQQTKITYDKMNELKALNEKTVAEMQTNDGAFQLAKMLYDRLDVYGRGGRI
jgi:hypothetical protein